MASNINSYTGFGYYPMSATIDGSSGEETSIDIGMPVTSSDPASVNNKGIHPYIPYECITTGYKATSTAASYIGDTFYYRNTDSEADGYSVPYTVIEIECFLFGDNFGGPVYDFFKFIFNFNIINPMGVYTTIPTDTQGYIAVGGASFNTVDPTQSSMAYYGTTSYKRYQGKILIPGSVGDLSYILRYTFL